MLQNANEKALQILCLLFTLFSVYKSEVSSDLGAFDTLRNLNTPLTAGAGALSVGYVWDVRLHAR